MSKTFILFATASMATAVSLGALGAHFLKDKVEAGLLSLDNLNAFETAVRYHIYHSIALLVIHLLQERNNTKLIRSSGYFFITGIFLFSVSIYLLSTQNLLGISNIGWLGPITPLGGLCLITGWVLLFINFLKK